jgi:hypothetical protein
MDNSSNMKITIHLPFTYPDFEKTLQEAVLRHSKIALPSLSSGSDDTFFATKMLQVASFFLRIAAEDTSLLMKIRFSFETRVRELTPSEIAVWTIIHSVFLRHITKEGQLPFKNAHSIGCCPTSVTAAGPHLVDLFEADRVAQIVKSNVNKKLGGLLGWDDDGIYHIFNAIELENNKVPRSMTSMQKKTLSDEDRALLTQKLNPQLTTEATAILTENLTQFSEEFEKLESDKVREMVSYELVHYFGTVLCAAEYFLGQEHPLLKSRAVEASKSLFEKTECPASVEYAKFVENSWSAQLYFHFAVEGTHYQFESS